MSRESLFTFLADAILMAHAVFVGFLIFGLVAIYIGRALKWSWVRNIWFRLLHLIGIGIVILQSWIGVVCPLTTWEIALREKAGADAYSGTFIQHWLQSILYYSAPEWVFVTIYTIFGAFVLSSWFIVPPNSSPGSSNASIPKQTQEQ
jgi:hypothetical protein